MRILIVKLSAIGDVIHSLPFLSAIKKSYPHSKISWVVSEKAYPLLVNHEMLERVYLFKREKLGRDVGKPWRWPNFLGDFWDFYRQIKSEYFDIVVDLQGLLKSSLIVAMANSKRKIGFESNREFSSLSLTERLPKYDRDMHAVDRYLTVAQYLGADIKQPDFPLTFRDDDYIVVEKIMKENDLRDNIVGIIPGAGWKTKLWTPYGFSRLIEYLHSIGLKTVIIGSSNDRNIANEIKSQLRGVSCVDLTGKTNLKILYLLYKRMKFVVSTDTGPMHLADASGVKVISLFGPTAPWRTGPYNNLSNVIRLGLRCSPCFKKECKEPRCMTEITPEMVMEKINRII